MHIDERKIKHFKQEFGTQFINLICHYAQIANKSPATVGKIINGKYTLEYNKWCTAEFVDYTSFINDINIIENKCRTIVENEYNIKCLESEIHFLHYKTGSYYKSHIDGQYIENDTAKRGVDRDITCVVYLNEDYFGGEIIFDFFNKRLRPNMGDILTYPTTWQYAHGVEPVNGERYAIVFWFKTSPELNLDQKIHDKGIIRFLQSITS